MQGIIQYLKSQGYSTIDQAFYRDITSWMKWYRGKTAFHSYRVYNGTRHVSKTRKSMGMAKRVAEDWANLLLNEKVEIVIENGEEGQETADRRQETVDAVLAENNFHVKANQLVEVAFALGTGAMVEYLDEEDHVKIDYIRAGMIYPLRSDNGEITECAFASERKEGKDAYVYLSIHEKNDRGNYIIKNAYFRKNGGGQLTQVPLPENIAEEVDTKSSVPLFQIIKPNIVNNIDLDNPMGISVYANAIDQMEGLDLVYDSYCNEFQLGKKRIVIPVKMARIEMAEDGSARPVFDPDDTDFYAISGAEENMGLKEINMEIRSQDHETGLKTALNLLAKKCGLGDKYYEFEAGGAKTATEVISEESDLFRNLKKHELILRAALTNMVIAIGTLSGLQIKKTEVTVNFDDSIIEDVGKEKERFLQEIRDGVRQKWEYRSRFFGEDEETAKANVQQDDMGWTFEEE